MTKPEWSGLKARYGIEQMDVFFDGTFTSPQLNHPEGIAIDQNGDIWTGGEQGEIFRISGNGIEKVADTGGFVLGVTFDREGFLYACDLKQSSVFKIDPASGEVRLFSNGEGQMKIPNVPVVDDDRNYLYVTDSHDSGKPGPGIWRFDLQSGEGRMWYEKDLVFANGLVLDSQNSCLYVAETFAKRISRIPIDADGEPGPKETVVEVDALPDGLALDDRGRLYIPCYEPSLIYRWSEEAGLELLCYDPTAHTLCHPTNCVIHGKDLYTSNLGRWHITRIPGVMD
ncbi:SMP-30/gluconolactonase/LRE family protein [Bacillus sp. sid0103]|uniref:SMP-30/gluconolactonase/LRE family protein n=1 Tax=Bacillus sp. sid0103 TaxID=2856337 RepID=UPI001C4945DD|nr:SMP-30/gluconolactonase/LRE family protein [Bacillus sp. sid0103]MBV7504368.1 SMP-30/gluconolactonase/LRE family protein [Bacillus sp. sid0103]